MTTAPLQMDSGVLWGTNWQYVIWSHLIIAELFWIAFLENALCIYMISPEYQLLKKLSIYI